MAVGGIPNAIGGLLAPNELDLCQQILGRSFVSGRLRAVLQETGSMRTSRPAPTNTMGRASSAVGLSKFATDSYSQKRPGEFFSSPGLLIFVECFGFLRQDRRYLLAVDAPLVPRKSANSVELLILVTNQGSGPRLTEGCSWMTRPIGVGPNAME